MYCCTTDHALIERLVARRCELAKEYSDSIRDNPYSAASIAHRIHVHPVTFCVWENKHQVPRSLDIWQKWTKALGLNLSKELARIRV